MFKSRLQPGGPGGPGRPKGSRNALSESFLTALHADFQAHGVEAIAAARAENPLGYVRMVASLLPQKLQVESGGGMSDDDLLVIIQRAHDEADAGHGGTVKEQGHVH
jgi:hypothetical protein